MSIFICFYNGIRDTWGLKNNSIKYIIRNGYRGEPFLVIKDKEEIRIFILGGSFVFDIGVGYKQDWPNRVEQILKRKGLKNINIIFGHINLSNLGTNKFDNSVADFIYQLVKGVNYK